MLGISANGLSARGNVYHEVVYQNRSLIPLPNEIKAVTKDMWKCLAWLYSHTYFTRVWVIQEINANQSRLVHCGHLTIEWDQVELVAGYIIMEPAFSKAYGFTDTPNAGGPLLLLQSACGSPRTGYTCCIWHQTFPALTQEI
ncbi:hypothetical protein IWW34DRAFT_729130 [Fusarium oxysporum f. sp. albedinis]|jgi:hypothetical protein|nr:hypothetical protein IWW34DRAFT_729130 [Fusarium oxysporum f. sp. albedinis]